MIYISVIVPAYNCRKTIDETLKSLLAQDFPANKYEIIVVDNSSKDSTVGAAKKYPIKIATCTKRGSYNARNEGARRAKGEILAFTDADCKVDRNWLFEIEKAFEDSNLHAVQGQGNLTHQKDPKVKAECFIDEYMTEIIGIREKRLWGDTKNFAIRKHVFTELGGFIPFKAGCDILFMEELRKRKYNVKLNKKLIVYHNYSLSSWKIIQKSLKYGLADILLVKSNNKSRLEGLLDIFSFYRLVANIV